MMKRCLEEGLLQAYLDGELAPEQMSAAAAHVAACEACADALAEAACEAAFFSKAFAPDDSISVPTEALRSRVYAAIAQMETGTEANRGRTRGPVFGGFIATLSGLLNFTPQSAAAFAGLLAFVALAVIFFAVTRQTARPTNVNERESAKAESAPPSIAPGMVGQPVELNDSGAGGALTPADGHIIPVSASRRARGVRAERRPVTLQTKGVETLPGEKDYQTAIASLEKTIKLGGDATIRPSVRVEYERDLALLDSTIKDTRRVAAENPKDRDAVGFLMSAYQSKVELLTKVADQSQVAALGR
jgi:anti-sigma factor RsiW